VVQARLVNGTKNYDEKGVTVDAPQTFGKFTPAGGTAPGRRTAPASSS
jgi:hypothetical protein